MGILFVYLYLSVTLPLKLKKKKMELWIGHCIFSFFSPVRTWESAHSLCPAISKFITYDEWVTVKLRIYGRKVKAL